MKEYITCSGTLGPPSAGGQFFLRAETSVINESTEIVGILLRNVDGSLRTVQANEKAPRSQKNSMEKTIVAFEQRPTGRIFIPYHYRPRVEFITVCSLDTGLVKPGTRRPEEFLHRLICPVERQKFKYYLEEARRLYKSQPIENRRPCVWIRDLIIAKELDSRIVVTFPESGQVVISKPLDGRPTQSPDSPGTSITSNTLAVPGVSSTVSAPGAIPLIDLVGNSKEQPVNAFSIPGAITLKSPAHTFSVPHVPNQSLLLVTKEPLRGKFQLSAVSKELQGYPITSTITKESLTERSKDAVVSPKLSDPITSTTTKESLTEKSKDTVASPKLSDPITSPITKELLTEKSKDAVANSKLSETPSGAIPKLTQKCLFQLQSEGQTSRRTLTLKAKKCKNCQRCLAEELQRKVRSTTPRKPAPSRRRIVHSTDESDSDKAPSLYPKTNCSNDESDSDTSLEVVDEFLEPLVEVTVQQGKVSLGPYQEESEEDEDPLKLVIDERTPQQIAEDRQLLSVSKSRKTPKEVWIMKPQPKDKKPVKEKRDWVFGTEGKDTGRQVNRSSTCRKRDAFGKSTGNTLEYNRHVYVQPDKTEIWHLKYPVWDMSGETPVRQLVKEIWQVSPNPGQSIKARQFLDTGSVDLETPPDQVQSTSTVEVSKSQDNINKRIPSQFQKEFLTKKEKLQRQEWLLNTRLTPDGDQEGTVLLQTISENL